jgi:hypothetical protein
VGETDSLHLFTPLCRDGDDDDAAAHAAERVLRPERAIQEMTAWERRARHSRYRRDARAEWRRVGATSTHAKREHTIEHCPSIKKSVIDE